MSKYCLVAKVNCFDGGIKYVPVIKLGENDLSSLIAIDEFTSCYDKYQIFSMIDRGYKVDGMLKDIVIRGEKRDKEKCVYWDVITEDKEFCNCVSEVINETRNMYRVDNNGDIYQSKMKTEFVRKDSELYKREYKKLLEKINDGSFYEYYYKNSRSVLVKLVNMYRESKDYYDKTGSNNALEDMEKKLKSIADEFSRYKTFRGWYVLGKYPKKVSEKSSNEKTYQRPKENEKSKKGVEKSIEEIEKNIKKHEEDYDKENYIDKYGVSYDEFNLYKYNIDNDTYFDSKEYEEMFYYERSKRRR